MIIAIERTAYGNFDNQYVHQKEDGGQFDYVLAERDMELRIASNEVEDFMPGRMRGISSLF